MLEASRIFRYSGWQRFWQLEMPFSTIGLVWNSIVSVAGGWFALIFCETFTMGDRSFQLPGLGSYIQTATYAGDVHALLAGIATVILIVVATDQLVWRPLIPRGRAKTIGSSSGSITRFASYLPRIGLRLSTPRAFAA